MAQQRKTLFQNATYTATGSYLLPDIDSSLFYSAILQSVFTYDNSKWSSVSITVQGSIDGTNYTDIDVQTITESGDLMFCLSLCPVPIIRLKIDLTNTSADTFTLKHNIVGAI